MRERTPFGADLLERLPDLRLLVTTGAANASIDVAAANRLGVTVCGTRSLPAADRGADLGADPRPGAAASRPRTGIRAGGWQNTLGVELAGRTLGLVGLGRLGSRVARVGLAFGMDVARLEPEPHPERGRRARASSASRKDELLRALRRGDGAPQAQRPHPRPRRRRRARRHEADGVPREHLARPDRRRGRAARGAARAAASPAPASTCTTRSRCPRDHPLRWAPRTLLTPHIGYVTGGGYQLFYGDAVEDIRAWMDGAPVRVVEP